MQQSAIHLNSISGLFHGSKGLIQLLNNGSIILNSDAQLVSCCHSFTWKNYWVADLTRISTALCFGILRRPGKCSLSLFLWKEKSPSSAVTYQQRTQKSYVKLCPKCDSFAQPTADSSWHWPSCHWLLAFWAKLNKLPHLTILTYRIGGGVLNTCLVIIRCFSHWEIQ